MRITVAASAALAAVLLLALPAVAGKKLESLEGTRWAIRVETGEKTDARGEEAFDEVVVFRDGKAVLETVAGRGYPAVPFVARKDGNKWEISFEQTSASDGVMRWEGDVREEFFKGIMLWTRKDGKVRNFWFKGKLVVERKKN